MSNHSLIMLQLYMLWYFFLFVVSSVKLITPFFSKSTISLLPGV